MTEAKEDKFFVLLNDKNAIEVPYYLQPASIHNRGSTSLFTNQTNL